MNLRVRDKNSFLGLLLDDLLAGIILVGGVLLIAYLVSIGGVQ